MPKKIKQPADESIKAAKAEVRFAWNKTFGKDATERFGNAQKFTDSEVIRLMVQYTPARNMILSKAGVLGTKIGSGHIYVLSPYGRYQYYGLLMVSRLTGSPYASRGESKVITGRKLNYDKTRHPKAQRLWFETTKAKHKEQIIRGAARIAGGKAKI